jgi:hypothetical protein
LHLLWSERHLYDVPEQERRTGVGEITQLVSRYQPQYIEMVDNILDMKYFRDLVPELERRRLKISLFYETKANLTKEQVRALSAAGIATIQPGIESLSTEVLTARTVAASSIVASPRSACSPSR